MEIEEIKEEIKNFDFNFLKYINSETKELGNKVILFSSLIIFVNLNYISISELEFTGVKILMEKDILLIIFFFVNIYYFLQFINSTKIDSLIARVPDSFADISKKLTLKVDIRTKSVNRLTKEYNEAIESKDFGEEKMKSLSNKKSELDNDDILELTKYWKDFAKKGINYHKRNRLLNQIFPIVCFVISILSFAVLLFNKICA